MGKLTKFNSFEELKSDKATFKQINTSNSKIYESFKKFIEFLKKNKEQKKK